MKIGEPESLRIFEDNLSFDRVIIPVGSSGVSSDAAALAARVCDVIAGTVRLVHVHIDNLSGPNAEELTLIATAIHKMHCSGLPADGVIVSPGRMSVASAVAKEAEAWRADTIIMTRRARWRRNHACSYNYQALSRSMALAIGLFGSVSDQVARKVTCPALIAHPNGTYIYHDPLV